MMTNMVILFIEVFIYFFSHPAPLILSIIFLTLYCTVMFYFMSKMSWMSILFILLMLGGLVILFIYMSSLSSNNMFFLSKKYMLISVIINMFILINFTYKLNFFSCSNMMISVNFSNFSLFCYSFGMMFLFLSLIFIIDLLSYLKSSIRSKF